MKEKIKVVIKKPGRAAKVKIMSVDSPMLARMHDAVPNEVTAGDIPGIADVYGYSNIDGAKTPKPNVFYPHSRFSGVSGTTVYGTMLYAAAPAQEGEMKSLTDEQAAAVMEFAAKNAVKNNFEDVFHRVTNFKYYDADRAGKPSRAELNDLELMRRITRGKGGREMYERVAALITPDTPKEVPRLLSEHTSESMRQAYVVLAAANDKETMKNTSKKAARVKPATATRKKAESPAKEENIKKTAESKQTRQKGTAGSIAESAKQARPEKNAKIERIEKSAAQSARADEMKPLVKVTTFNDFRAWQAAHKDEVDQLSRAYKALPKTEKKSNSRGGK